MSLDKLHNEMKTHQVRMKILILGIHCPLCLGSISGKAIQAFSLTLVRKKKIKEQDQRGTATLRNTIKMSFLSICQSH